MATPDFRHLTVFHEAARLGSMSKAAAGLGLAQPTISARISDLEAELGVVLLRRTARGVVLTDAGRRFLPYAERCLALLKEGQREARREAGRREIRLAAPASLAETLFPHMAPELVKRGFDVSLSIGHSPQVIEMLLDGRIDAGIRGRGPTMASIASVALPSMAIVCVARSDHPLAELPPRTYGLADIAVYGLAVFEWDEQVADLLERVRFAAGVAAITGYVKVSPAEVARRLVVEHGAVAFLPEPTVARDLAANRVMVLAPKDGPEYHWPLMLVHRDQRTSHEGVAAVIKTAESLLLMPARVSGTLPSAVRAS
jgi:DNA-binding transcriptional LysR family regulator